MDANKAKNCLLKEKDSTLSNEKAWIRFDFEGLIIEVRESTITKPMPTKKQCDLKCDAMPVGDSAASKNPNTPEFQPKPKQVKVASTDGNVPDLITLTPEASDCEGAAGLLLQDYLQTNGFCDEPEISPPPVTEEDLAIIRQFMEEPEPGQVLNKLMTNEEEFVCSICESFILKNEGAMLTCSHTFCRSCLINEIDNNHDEMGQVKCPFPLKCESYVVDEEVEDLLGEDYGKFIWRVAQMQDAVEREKIRIAEASLHDTLPALLETDNHDFIENYETFECSICLTDIVIGAGVVLKNCLHKFCKDCISETVCHSDEFIVKCPYNDSIGSCEFTLQEREIRALVADNIFEKHLEKSLKLYEGITSNAYHCKTPDCKGFIEIAENANAPNFTCEVCMKQNCIKCKAIHEGKSCQDYQDEIDPEAPTARHRRENADSEAAIDNLVAAGTAMKCPRCEIAVQKTEGCDFLICATCKLELCWRTKKPRRPLTLANGTVIDGCHCRENGTPCHPLCQNCH